MDLHCMLVIQLCEIRFGDEKAHSRFRVVVYSPQMLENYQLKSGEGLSLVFVLVWLLGDLCNLGGALMAKLLPTVIILGAYVSRIRLHLEFS